MDVVDKVVVSVKGVQTLLFFQVLKEASYNLMLSEKSGSFSEVVTDISTSNQEPSSEYSCDDNVQVQVIAAMELLPRPGVKIDPYKVEMNEEKVCRQLSTLRFDPKVTDEKNARFLDIF
ncbi:hypothetical protein AXG93_4368s2400 [Marchantia polymorpha subsp. ruderalis]|uniref:Uncharacterized protein n=1 Tax=Marchantia polymorpha subsp. ruderalis TaxID=1480154 RepID=A0A176VY99_MARPO|nr:hypothetical protein AXG93_4368s2400 [Marchantia polymorpha subsp. ruderalis]